MALSVVNFRMKHGKEMEQVKFSGNGIKLLDLKKEIAERKLNFGQNRQTDYDLKIMDAGTNQEFPNDDDVVPKNSSVIAQRFPVKNPRLSLLFKIENRGYIPPHLLTDSQPSEIIMPTKEEEPETVEPADNEEQENGDDIFSLITEEKTYVTMFIHSFKKFTKHFTLRSNLSLFNRSHSFFDPIVFTLDHDAEISVYLSVSTFLPLIVPWLPSSYLVINLSCPELFTLLFFNFHCLIFRP